ncbi:MAG: alanine--tRNA ligase [Roseburia sp.]|nr:alanine--tRNA ligase [Anaeroplasma bactoclasticum]MCM1195843.1 alanine--tRNA ligase [Roseburia sp.]MCM1556314.1 alanine--tRNA ligase [Anaeroplasma bactoclasticum]
MKKMTSSEIRQMWLDFYKSKGHKVEPSASLVPHDDPTLLWTNAGVTPLKKYFDGSVVPECPRITNAQKCIRTNDIENVGDTYHHTFFEMLGNFSIGDYFKKEAIAYAYELLFSEKWFGFDKDRIFITYYPEDLEAKKLWMKQGISEEHLIPLTGNFWEIGEGPCGPDTEMFFDRGEKYDKRGKELIANDIDNDRFIEIGNIVFSQFSSKEGVDRKDYKELPSKNIDTGWGLERLCSVMQGAETNYDTDLFRPIIAKTEEISGVTYKDQRAFRVIADHVRTVTFAVADGAVMSNEGRGYVLRRVLRRASKYAKSLGIEKPFMAELVDVVISIMDPYYPYLHEKAAIIKKIISSEEEKFLATLASGEKRFDVIAAKADKVISGVDAFTLYDTYGFPIELTKEYALEKNLAVDEEGFSACLLEQKKRARNARKDENSMGGQNETYLNFKEPSTFTGYRTTSQKAKVIGVFEEGIVLNETPFYAFSGGQLCDKGTINDIKVKDVIKMPNGQHLHIVEENPFQVGDEVDAIVDKPNRDLTRKNHSSAHLLQAALQKVLGNHVHQQGSQVCASYCRFDFNNYTALTDEQILAVEDLVNRYILEAHKVNTFVLPIEEAKELGAMALFGEKYGSMVRVVDMGISKEFCAGTHVENTSQIESFAIYSLESIGSGTFRVTASSSKNAMQYVKAYTDNVSKSIEAILNKAHEILKESASEGIALRFGYNFKEPEEVGYRYILAMRNELAKAQAALKALEKEFSAKKSQSALSDLNRFDSSIENGKLFVKVDAMDSALLKDMACALRNNKNLDVVFFASVDGEKVTFVCATKSLDASMLVKEAAKLCQGGGGGKKDLAQAGGKDASKVDAAIAKAKELCR